MPFLHVPLSTSLSLFHSLNRLIKIGKGLHEGRNVQTVRPLRQTSDKKQTTLNVKQTRLSLASFHSMLGWLTDQEQFVIARMHVCMTLHFDMSIEKKEKEQREGKEGKRRRRAKYFLPTTKTRRLTGVIQR
mmetsp:Transcript_25845/g.50655  ORF Transcript_25845/g.50655 Transcript_25845/m.50655 type:complete len:131 (+) Transcript_25845:534-926(+)